MKGYFYIHLADAIKTNRARRAHYIKQTNGKARVLSYWLVSSEVMCLPLARYFDSKAQPFIEQGVPIVQNDFIDMEHIAELGTATKYQGVADKASCQQVHQALKALKKDGLAALKQQDYLGVCQQTAHAIDVLDKSEQQAGAHFAMSKHILESLGLAALHAPKYLEQSGGETEKLAKQLVGIQLWLADTGIYMDKLAQNCHAMGAGIIVNDVPEIPFLAEFEKRDLNE